MKRVLFVLLGVALLLLSSAPLMAQEALAITSSQFTANFRKELTFQVEAQSRAPITRVELFIEFETSPSSFRGTAKFDEGTRVSATYTWNLEQKYLPPGVAGQFWWEIADQAGQKITSRRQPFRVEDTRFKWQVLSEPRFALYWYGGDMAFGKVIFERAVSAMDALQRDTGVTVERQLQIFLYDKRADFLGALEPVVSDWVGGRAYTDHGITLIHVSASNLSFGLVATPHELTHLIIHRKLGDIGRTGFPRWLDEGLAMYYEFVPPKLDLEYETLLKRAIQNDTLLPLRTLSGNFATDARQAALSYAQSFSVVDFIYRRYGKDKMTQMLLEFKKGKAFDEVFLQVLGVDTEGLEAAWRQDIGAKPRALPARPAFTPTPFPTFALSTDLTAPTPPRQATPAPTPIAVAATPAPAPTAAPRAAANPLTQVCGGSLLVLGGVFGVALYRRRYNAHG
jgi:hypothetical protein